MTSIYKYIFYKLHPLLYTNKLENPIPKLYTLLFFLPMHRRNYRCQMKQYSISKCRFFDLKLRMMIRITLSSMVEAGLGVSIVHSLLIKPERYHVAVLPLNVKQSREIGIAVKKGFLPSTITQLFLQHVVDYTKDMGEITVIRH